MQDLVAERDFYEELFRLKPDNEHITDGYEDLHELAFQEPPDGPVLDLGCGTGAHAVRLARRGYDVIAVELTRRGIQATRERFERDGLRGTFVIADAEALPFRDGAVSVAWTSLLIHHFPDARDLAAEIARVTRHRVIAFEPNAGNFLTWFAMNVVNRYWGIKAMTRNQVALHAGGVERLFRRYGFQRLRLNYIQREWQDRMRGVRRLYGTLTAWLPERFQANKFLVVFTKAES